LFRIITTILHNFVNLGTPNQPVFSEYVLSPASIGGAAAILARDNIKKVEVLEYPELSMEAVWKIDVVDFPAFILVDYKGNDFFSQLAGCK
jgi:tartrate dehydratase beta subunit/fumarate hydratase class I family protein